MDADQAWQVVLRQLEQELPKASFSTWVSETRAEGCDERMLTVGCANRYCRDWLETRLAGRAEQILAGAMGRPLRVRFVVTPPRSVPDPASRVLRDRGTSGVSDVAGEEDQQGDIPQDRGPSSQGDGLSVELAQAATRYAQQVQPERVVAPYAYAFRLIHFGDVTPKQFSLWIGFRQAVYSLWRRGGGTVRNIPWQDVCRFAMMARASFFREIKDLSLPGLVEQIEIPKEKQHYRDRAGRLHQRANLYRVSMDPPLARADAAALLGELRARSGIERSRIEAGMPATERVERAAGALEALAGESVADILAKLPQGGEPLPRSATSPDVALRDVALRPLTVPELVRQLVGMDDLPESLQTAAEDLHQRVISAFGTAHVTHYFLEKAAPALGLSHAQAWLIAQLRDRCFEDPDTGEVRDWVLVPGGYRTLSRWAGVSPRRKTVYEWLRQAGFARFVSEIRPDPLEPEIVAAGLQEDARRLLDTWAERDVRVLAVSLKEPLLERYAGETSVGTQVRPFGYAAETLREYGDETPVGTQVRLARYVPETHFKLFKALRKTPQSPENTSTGERSQDRAAEAAGQGAVSLPSAWVLDRLLAQNRVHPKVQKSVRGGDAKALVSWILYGASFGAQKPLSYGLSRFAEDPLCGAGDDFDRLAALPPAQLIEMIADAAHSRTGQEWLKVVGTTEPREAAALLRILLGDKAPIRISRETTSERIEYGAGGAGRRVVEERMEEG